MSPSDEAGDMLAVIDEACMFRLKHQQTNKEIWKTKVTRTKQRKKENS